MAAEVLAPIVELAVYALAAVAEIAIYIVAASVRPWCYVLSAKFRQNIDAKYANRHPVFKWLSLIGGFVLLPASVAIGYSIVINLVSIHEASLKHSPTLKERAINSAASAANQWVKDKFNSTP